MRIFWDTNLFIYLWEGGEHAPVMDCLADFVEREQHTLATSTLTLGEILVHPFRRGTERLVRQYRQAFSN